MIKNNYLTIGTIFILTDEYNQKHKEKIIHNIPLEDIVIIKKKIDNYSDTLTVIVETNGDTSYKGLVSPKQWEKSLPLLKRKSEEFIFAIKEEKALKIIKR